MYITDFKIGNFFIGHKQLNLFLFIHLIEFRINILIVIN